MAGFKITILVGDVDLGDLTKDQASQIMRLRVEDVVSNHVLFGLTNAKAKHISVSVRQLQEVDPCSPKSTSSPSA